MGYGDFIDKVEISILRDVPENQKYKSILHEIGHVLGLAHTDNRKSTMFLGHTPSEIDSVKIGECEVYTIYSNNQLDESFYMEKRLEMTGEEICK